MRRFKQPPHGSYTPSPIHPPLRRSSTSILFPSMNETCVGYLSLSSIGSTLPSVSSTAGTPSSSEISSFRLSFGYFFCKSSSRSRMEDFPLTSPAGYDTLAFREAFPLCAPVFGLEEPGNVGELLSLIFATLYATLPSRPYATEIVRS